MELSRPKSNW